LNDYGKLLKYIREDRTEIKILIINNITFSFLRRSLFLIQPIIWIEGIIGVGKTTFAKELGRKLNFQTLEEPLNEDLLQIYYEDQNSWGFSFQIDMLHKRHEIHSKAMNIASMGKGVILDRGLPGDRVFANMLSKDGKIHPINWEIYENAYRFATHSIAPPTLLIFLDVTPEIAHKRIKNRNRHAEQEDLLPLSYLERLYQEYRALINEFYTGSHPWSNKTEIWEIDWNPNWKSLAPLADTLKTYFRVLNFFYSEKTIVIPDNDKIIIVQ
jgi:deoxyadenosine/deoxycytidine kinase